MAEINAEQMEQRLKNAAQGKNNAKKDEVTDAAMTAPAAAGTPATASVTSEFTGAKDPTWPAEKQLGKIVRAEEAFKTEKVTIAGKEEVVHWYRVYEKDGNLVEVPYQLSNGMAVTKEGREEIKSQNRAAVEKQHAYLASLKQTQGPRIALMEYLRKFSTNHGVFTPNEVANELSVVLAPADKNSVVAQKRYKTAIREKSPGGVKQWLLSVPARCFELLTEGNSVYDGATVESIVNETAPKLKPIAVPKDEFPKMMLSVFGGAIKVAENIYDGNTGKYKDIKDIPSINGMAAGVEMIYYSLDDKKIALAPQSIKTKPGESSEDYKKRVKANSERQERGQRYKSGGMSLDDKASIIRVRSNARTSMVSSINYIPLRTFDKIPVGVMLNPKTAADYNNLYLRKLGTGVLRIPEETANLRDVDGVIESSIYFPSDANHVGKLKEIKGYFRMRKADGTVAKPTMMPKSIIAKELVQTEKGGERPMNKAHAFNEEGYNKENMDFIRGRFNDFMGNMPESMRCPFLTVEEIAAANKRSRNSTVSTKISSSGIDQGLLNEGLLMLDLAIGSGEAVIAVAETKQGIEAIRTSKSAPVVNRKRFTQEQLAERLAPKA